MEIYLIRHFATENNLARRYPSGTDTPILPIETDQAVRNRADALKEAKIMRIVVSPALRTRQTSDFYFPGQEVFVDSAFSELDVGIFSGRTSDEMTDDEAYTDWVNGGCLDAPPEGEAPESLFQRVQTAFTNHLAKAKEDGFGAIAFVSHAGPIRAIINMLFDTDPFSLEIPTGGVLRVIMDSDHLESETLS